jgi:hypothetical protein
MCPGSGATPLGRGAESTLESGFITIASRACIDGAGKSHARNPLAEKNPGYRKCGITFSVNSMKEEWLSGAIIR